MAQMSVALMALLPATSLAQPSMFTVRGEVAERGQFTLPEGSRVLDGIRQSRPLPTAYWLGAFFTRQAHVPDQESLKSAVLSKLRDRAKMEKSEDRTCLINWILAVQAMPVTGRMMAEMDPAILDTEPKTNILLRTGDRLSVPTRPENILIQGLVEKEARLPYRYGLTAADYLRQVARCDEADPSFVWLIYPDGKTQQIGVAYWNEEPVRLAPGTRIYVPPSPPFWEQIDPDPNFAMARFLATQPQQ